jgi:hypothetical protein
LCASHAHIEESLSVVSLGNAVRLRLPLGRYCRAAGSRLGNAHGITVLDDDPGRKIDLRKERYLVLVDGKEIKNVFCADDEKGEVIAARSGLTALWL